MSRLVNTADQKTFDLKCYRVSTAKDGPHTIYPSTAALPKLEVLCDQTVDGGGWVVLMRRLDGTVNFTSRTWASYKNGFGQHGENTELWLGNEYVHQLTYDHINKPSEIRMEAYAFDGTICTMTANNFHLENESESYTLRLGKIKSSRTCPPANTHLRKHINNPFQTNDRRLGNNFGFTHYQGGWWYNNDKTRYLNCQYMHFTGRYHSTSEYQYDSILVYDFTRTHSLKGCAMLFRTMDSAIRPCNNPCLNTGSCEYIEATNTSRCVCPRTQCGIFCERHNPCLNGGTCNYLEATNNTRCVCPKTHCGVICEKDNRCLNGGTCNYLEATNNTRCVCPKTHCGVICEKDNRCLNGGTCNYLEATNNTRCVCPKTHCGVICEKDNRCLNGGTCNYLKATNSTRCVCPKTHCGVICEKDNRCLNGGTCNYLKATNSTRCVCPKTHCGVICEKDSRCLNGGTCNYLEATNSTRCVCPKTHCGFICERRDPTHEQRDLHIQLGDKHDGVLVR